MNDYHDELNELKDTLPTNENMEAALKTANSLDFDDPDSAGQAYRDETSDEEVEETQATDDTDVATPAEDKAEEPLLVADTPSKEHLEGLNNLIEAAEEDENLFDPEVLEHLKGLSESYTKAVADLTAMNEQSVKLTAEAGEAKLTAWGAKNGYSDLLDGESDRAAIQTEIATIKAGYEATNRDVPASDELINRAVNALYPDHKPTTSNDEVASRQSQFMAPPDGDRRDSSSTLTPEQRAERAVAKIMKGM